MDKKNTAHIIIAVLITALVVGFGMYFLQSKNTNQNTLITDNTREEVTKPIITFPKNEEKIDGYTIKGKAPANTGLWVYVNYTDEEFDCITANSYASGGFIESDSNGNFETELNTNCTEEISVRLSMEDREADKNSSCRSEEFLSEVVTFTNTGDLPQACE